MNFYFPHLTGKMMCTRSKDHTQMTILLSDFHHTVQVCLDFIRGTKRYPQHQFGLITQLVRVWSQWILYCGCSNFSNPAEISQSFRICLHLLSWCALGWSGSLQTSSMILGCLYWRLTRWTFFRVKLIFEYDFEISRSLRPLNLFPPPPPAHTSSYLHLSLPISSYLLLHSPIFSSFLLLCPPTSFYLLLPPGLVWFGMGGGWGGVLT